MNKCSDCGEANKIMNTLVESTKRLAAGKSPVDLKLARVRMTICNKCDEFIERPVMRCGKCGCFLSLLTATVSSKCDLGKW